MSVQLSQALPEEYRLHPKETFDEDVTCWMCGSVIDNEGAKEGIKHYCQDCLCEYGKCGVCKLTECLKWSD